MSLRDQWLAADTDAEKAGVLDGASVARDAQIAAINARAQLFWVDVAATAALLDSAGSVTVKAGEAGYRFKVRDIKLIGGGTNFGGAGNRLLDLTDGTTVWTTIANADLESAPATTLPWGNAKVPFLTGTCNTPSVAEADIVLKYSGGTTDHSTGAITFSVLLDRLAA
jgi:hypothetical protein